MNPLESVGEAGVREEEDEKKKETKSGVQQSTFLPWASRYCYSRSLLLTSHFPREIRLARRLDFDRIFAAGTIIALARLDCHRRPQRERQTT